LLSKLQSFHTRTEEFGVSAIALIIAIAVAANRGGKDSVILSEEKYYSSTGASPELYPSYSSSAH